MYTIIVPANTQLITVEVDGTKHLALPAGSISCVPPFYKGEDEVEGEVSDTFTHEEIYEYDLSEDYNLTDADSNEFGPVVGARPHVIRS